VNEVSNVPSGKIEVISGTMPSSTDELKTFAIGWLGINDNEQCHGPLA
jgi:hypothetical protein